MKFKYGMRILNADGEKVGELEQIVIKPGTERVTHLVAKKGFILPTDKVIPISLIREFSNDYLKLYNFDGSFEDLDDYIEHHYVKSEDSKNDLLMDENDFSILPLISYPPSGHAGLGFVPLINYPQEPKTRKVKNLPDESIEIQKGRKVVDDDGEHVGNVQRIVVDAQSDQVSHFVISSGLIFNEEKIIPSSWVKAYDSEQLKLGVKSTLIEKLPEYDS